MSDESVDLIIPLEDKPSKFGDWELRYCLRSFAQFGRGLGQVIIVSDNERDWAREVVWAHRADKRTDCKDANIIDKVLYGLGFCTTRKVVWCCDDCALLRPVNLAKMPKIYNNRGEEWFKAVPADRRTKWQRRMLRTFGEIRKLRAERGCMATRFECNYDSHTPQVYEEAELGDALEDAMARTGGDVCICTWAGLWAGWDGLVGAEQQSVKVTMEGKSKCYFGFKPFLGYNDAGFVGGAQEQLGMLFPSPCRFEAEGEGWAG